MASLEEFLQEFEEMGVDPTTVDLGSDYLYAFAPMQGASQQQGSLMGRPTGQNMDLTMSMSAIKMDQIMSSVDSLSRNIDRFLGAMQQNTMQTNMSINNLARLQMDAQQRISQSQISMPFAQALNPGMFPGAPASAYQTSPNLAVFRQQIGASTPLLAQMPAPTLFGDIMKGTSLRAFYEPSFAENPFLATYGARERLDDRMKVVMREGSNFGAQMGAGALSWQMINGLMGRIGLGAIPGIGLMANIADIGLNMAGLPSISGAVSSAVQGSWDATLGTYFNASDMSRDVQKATRFFTNPLLSGATGQGLSMASSGRVVQGLYGQASRNFALGTEDYFKIFTESANQGLFNLATDENQMLGNVRSVAKNLRLFMRISGDPDYRNAIKQMGDLFRMGVPFQDLGAAATNIYNFSRMAGVNMDQARTFGQQGALAFSQAGANVGVGYQAGIMSRAMSRIATQSGAFSPGMLARLGGEEGITQAFTETIGSFYAGPGQIVLPGLLRRNQSGGVEIDPTRLEQYQSGKLSLNDLRTRARDIMGSTSSAQSYFSNRMELMDEFTRRAGPIGGIQGILNTADDIMKRDPRMTYESALALVLGSEQQAYQFSRLINQGQVARYSKADMLRQNENVYNRMDTIRSQNILTNRMWTGFKEMTYDAIRRPLIEMSNARESRLEYERNLSMGILTDTPLQRSLTDEFRSSLGRVVSGSGIDTTDLISRTNVQGLSSQSFYDLSATAKGSRAVSEKHNINKMLSPGEVMRLLEDSKDIIGRVDHEKYIMKARQLLSSKGMSQRYTDANGEVSFTDNKAINSALLQQVMDYSAASANENFKNMADAFTAGAFKGNLDLFERFGQQKGFLGRLFDSDPISSLDKKHVQTAMSLAGSKINMMKEKYGITDSKQVLDLLIYSANRNEGAIANMDRAMSLNKHFGSRDAINRAADDIATMLSKDDILALQDIAEYSTTDIIGSSVRSSAEGFLNKLESLNISPELRAKYARIGIKQLTTGKLTPKEQEEIAKMKQAGKYSALSNLVQESQWNNIEDKLKTMTGTERASYAVMAQGGDKQDVANRLLGDIRDAMWASLDSDEREELQTKLDAANKKLFTTSKVTPMTSPVG